MKTCSSCGQAKPTDQFFRETRPFGDGYRSKCKACFPRCGGKRTPEQRRQWRINNPQYRAQESTRRDIDRPKERARVQSYGGYGHNRRARVRAADDGTMTPDAVIAMAKASVGCPCPYCGTTMHVPSMDHVIPLARGGAHSIANAMMICGPCNTRKRTRLPIEFIWEIPAPRHRQAQTSE